MQFQNQRTAILDSISGTPLAPGPLAVVDLADRIRRAAWKLRDCTPFEDRGHIRAAAIEVFEEFPLPAPDADTAASLKASIRPLLVDLLRGNLGPGHRRGKRRLTGLKLRNVVYELTFPEHPDEHGTLSKINGEWFFEVPKEIVRVRGMRPTDDDSPYVPPHLRENAAMSLSSVGGD